MEFIQELKTLRKRLQKEAEDFQKQESLRQSISSLQKLFTDDIRRSVHESMRKEVSNNIYSEEIVCSRYLYPIDIWDKEGINLFFTSQGGKHLEAFVGNLVDTQYPGFDIEILNKSTEDRVCIQVYFTLNFALHESVQELDHE